MKLILVLLTVFFVLRNSSCGIDFSPEKIKYYREKVKAMFYHAYDGYLNNAFPYDELKPITCAGMDTWGSFSLTLVDALDTLIVMGNYSEFDRAAKMVIKNIDVDANVNVSVFETNIRVIGGLLSAHMLSGISGVQLEDGWPCSGPLLRLAERLAAKLLPAFNSYTGMPYGTVNLRYGVHRHETPITCTAGVGTFLLEFASLSRLTGSPIYERVAMKAMNELWKTRSSIGLVGNHINVQTGTWTATDAGIGAGVDSYYEYLVKGAILFDKPEMMRQFREYKKAIEKYIEKDDWFMWVSMSQGQVTMPIFQSLEAFWPGLLTLVGDIDSAMRIILNYHQVLKQYGFTPEFYNIPNLEIVQKRGGYPLRPELAESLMYLYRATEDPLLLQIGVDLIEAIEHSAKTRCGYATIHDVKDHIIEDHMESFFLAETTKYLYLLFDPNNFIHNPGTRGVVVDTTSGKCVINSGGYVFNTEAHPFDPAVIYCCDKRRQRHNEILSTFHDNIDLLTMLGLSNERSNDFEFTDDDFDDVDELANRTTTTTTTTNVNAPYEIEYEIEQEQISPRPSSADEENEDDNDDDNASTFSETNLVEATENVKTPLSNRVLSPPDEQIATNNENQSTTTFAESINKALTKLLDEWKNLLNAETQLKSLSRLNSNGYCRRRDEISTSKTLNAMLNVVYNRDSSYFDVHASSNFICDPADAPKEEEHYFRSIPNVDKLATYDDADGEFENWTVKNMNFRTFNEYASQFDYHFELMSCKPRPFLSIFTGLGEVLLKADNTGGTK